MYLHNVLFDGVSNSSDTSSTKLYTFLRAETALIQS